MGDLAVLLLIAVAAVIAVRRVAWITRVASSSMEPTLRPADLRITRRLRRSERIRRGDIVVLRSPDLRRRVVKRVVGLPGETVTVGGRGVRIDGIALPEPYVRRHGGRTGTFRVPDGTWFVLGDDRPRSSDSRAWREPFVPRAAIEGRLLMVG